MSLSSLIGITTVYAADTAAPVAQQHPGGFLSVLWLPALLILIFYFLLIRPQSKRVKEQKALLGNLALNDEVITTGGILARVVKLKDNYIGLEIAKGTTIILQKNSIASLLPKGTIDAF